MLNKADGGRYDTVWYSENLSCGKVAVGDRDGNGVKEIDVAVGDLDGNSVLDLAVLTTESVYVFESGTWAEKLHKALSNGSQLAIANSDLIGPGELLVVTAGSSSGSQLQVRDPSFGLLWQGFLGDVAVHDIVTGELDGDGDEEFVVMGGTASDWDEVYPSFLLVGSEIAGSYWAEYWNDGYWGSINGMVLTDIDGDGQTGLLFGASSLIQANEITSSPMVFHKALLPMVAGGQ